MEETISQRVIRCAFNVSNTLGAGFLEKVYENALCVEFERDGIRFQDSEVYYGELQRFSSWEVRGRYCC